MDEFELELINDDDSISLDISNDDTPELEIPTDQTIEVPIETISRNGIPVPIINKNVDIIVPKNTSELINDSNFVIDAAYTHTDNNFTSAEKNKLSYLDKLEFELLWVNTDITLPFVAQEITFDTAYRAYIIYYRNLGTESNPNVTKYKSVFSIAGEANSLNADMPYFQYRRFTAYPNKISFENNWFSDSFSGWTPGQTNRQQWCVPIKIYGIK